MFYYEEIFKELNKEKIRYVIVGGVAVVLHGVVRLTVDLDIFVDLSADNIIKCLKALRKIGYRPKLPVKDEDFANPELRKKWQKEKNMKVFSLYHVKRHEELVDIFVYEPISFDKVYKDKKIIKVDKLKLPVISLKHLKQFKKLASRPQDLADITALKTIEKLKND